MLFKYSFKNKYENEINIIYDHLSHDMTWQKYMSFSEELMIFKNQQSANDLATGFIST